MPQQMLYGVGAHEPIFHRLRTGNSTAEEWERWERETSGSNLDILEELGITHVHIACTKGFGLEYEKPLIERAARFAGEAAGRGITTSAYVQGFPVYYETFLLEVPEAEDWLARNQVGDFIPWGGQTFRRWMDPSREEFLEYQFKVFEYILDQFQPTSFGVDNTRLQPFYSDSARESFRNYLRDRYTEEDALREFGIKSFDAVDLPHFDPIYWPQDAYRIVKDPMLQEWARWRSWLTADWCRRLREHIQSIAPEVKVASACGCGGLRYSQLFVRGVDFDDRIAALDATHMEESWWRPGVIETRQTDRTKVVMDERVPDAAAGAEKASIRVSTDSRFMKILQNYGMGGHRGFWGEHDRESKLVALSHNFAFGSQANNIGSVGPLAVNPAMIDDIKDVIDWGNEHIEVLTGRNRRIAPVAVWRGTSTINFIRHRPCWEACVIEQMLYEQHLPFTILLDGGIERFLDLVRVLILPGTQCVNDRQVDIISDFVRNGGNLLLLGPAGTRDERTRVRTRYAFEHLFGGSLPELELIGPPHWVPELDFDRMPETLSNQYGRGTIAFVKQITPPHELDLTRDPYMPERQVMVKDIVPPKNEEQIMSVLNSLYAPSELRADAPRWTLCEFWQRGRDLLICCANLRKGHDGGPLTLRLGKFASDKVTVHSLLEDDTKTLPVEGGAVTIESIPHFCAVEVKGVLPEPEVPGAGSLRFH